MIFPYVRYETEPTSTIPSGEIYRPEIAIRVHGPRKSLLVSGLVDTGADHVFLSSSIASALDIKSLGGPETALGAGGHDIEVWPATVELELTHEKQSYRWRAAVGLLASDEPPAAFYAVNLLGMQ